jgi:aminoglycoside 3-N-acetyltransferase
MLLGCHHNSNSLIHVAESLAEIPYIYTPTPGAPDGFHSIRQQDGRVQKIQLTEFTGCSKAFCRAEAPLREAGLIRDGKVGQSAVQIMKASEVLQVLTPLLNANPGSLLCDKPTCAFCVPRKESLRR